MGWPKHLSIYSHNWRAELGGSLGLAGQVTEPANEKPDLKNKVDSSWETASQTVLWPGHTCMHTHTCDLHTCVVYIHIERGREGRQREKTERREMRGRQRDVKVGRHRMVTDSPPPTCRWSQQQSCLSASQGGGYRQLLFQNKFYQISWSSAGNTSKMKKHFPI